MHGQARVKAHQPGRDCPAWMVSSATSLPIAPCTGAGGLHQPLRKQQQLLPQPRSCQSRVSSSEEDSAAAARHRRQLPGQPLQYPVPSGSQADVPIRLQKLNQMPHPDPRSKQMFHLKATISAFQSSTGAPIREHQRVKSKAPRLPRGSGTWTGLSHFPLPQTAAGQASLQH